MRAGAGVNTELVRDDVENSMKTQKPLTADQKAMCKEFRESLPAILAGNDPFFSYKARWRGMKSRRPAKYQYQVHAT